MMAWVYVVANTLLADLQVPLLFSLTNQSSADTTTSLWMVKVKVLSALVA
jgi:hypothetical protein